MPEPSAPDREVEADTLSDLRITLLIHSLNGGGSEHVAAWMASHWAEAGCSVTLITLDDVINDSAPLSPSVHRVGLALMRPSSNRLQGLLANWTRIRRIRSAILESSPEVVISLTDRMNILTILACRGTKHRPIVAERTDIRHHRIGRLWEFLRRRTYPQARAIVVQTRSVAEAVRPIAGRCPVEVIPNAVQVAENSSTKGDHPAGVGGHAGIRLNGKSHWICGVGRLSFEKGFDRLVQAFACVADEFPEWCLVVVGDGPERERLQELATESRLQERILFAGWHEEPWTGLHSAEIFVLPSRYEGFPNALLEAMARGLACIAVNCESGPSEIISDGTDGRLVPNDDSDSLKTALRELLVNEALRKRLATNAVDVIRRYSVSQYFERWVDLIRRTG